jgi:hypothetical protein
VRLWVGLFIFDGGRLDEVGQECEKGNGYLLRFSPVRLPPLLEGILVLEGIAGGYLPLSRLLVRWTNKGWYNQRFWRHPAS